MDGIHYMFYELNYTTNEQCNYLYRSWRILLMYNCLPWQLMVRVMYIYDINQIVYVGRRVMYANITSRCLITYNNITIWVSIYVHIDVNYCFSNISDSPILWKVVSTPSPPRWLCPLPPLRDGWILKYSWSYMITMNMLLIYDYSLLLYHPYLHTQSASHVTGYSLRNQSFNPHSQPTLPPLAPPSYTPHTNLHFQYSSYMGG